MNLFLKGSLSFRGHLPVESIHNLFGVSILRLELPDVVLGYVLHNRLFLIFLFCHLFLSLQRLFVLGGFIIVMRFLSQFYQILL